jgi:hypothetical protein
MVSMETLVSLCKRRGFVFQSSEIYGGIGSSWDYGPLGVELKNKIKRRWWRDFVQRRPDMLGLDASILMHPTVWKASGHVDNFTDSMVDCRECRHRFRVDQLAETPWVHYCPATNLPERRVRLHQSVEGLTSFVHGFRLETGRGHQVLPATLRHQPTGPESTEPGIDGRFRIPIDEGPDRLRVGGEELKDGPVGGRGGVHARRS